MNADQMQVSLPMSGGGGGAMTRPPKLHNSTTKLLGLFMDAPIELGPLDHLQAVIVGFSLERQTPGVAE